MTLPDDVARLRELLMKAEGERECEVADLATSILDALESAEAALDEERRLGKYYIKARVYGAIAAEYSRALKEIASLGGRRGLRAQQALDCWESNRNGVSMAAVEAIGELLDAARRAESAERERDELRAKVADYETSLRTALLLCKCEGTGRYTPRCYRCDDSTDDHECPDEVECTRRSCLQARAILAKHEAGK